ncbi:TolC family protein [Calditrichota bacterium LG25]
MNPLQYLLMLILFFAAFSPSALQAQSLEQAIKIALAQNKELKAQTQALKKRQLEARAAFRQTLPSLDFGASYRHVTHVAQIDFPALPTLPGLPSAVRLGRYDTYETSLTIKYVLFSGFAHKNRVRLMSQKSELEHITLEEKEKEIAFRVIAAYRNAQEKQLEMEAIKAAMERVAWQMKRTKSLIKQGMALGLDSLSLKLARLNYRKQLIAAQGALAIAEEQLKKLTGQKITIQSFSEPPEVRLNVMPVVKLTGPYRLLDQQQQMQSTAVKISRARYFPALAAFASYSYGRPGLDMIKGEWMDYGIWGVSLSWNLFSWNADRLNEQAARARFKQLDWQKQAVEDQLQTRFDRALREWQTLKEQQDVVQAALKVARQKMKVVAARYAQGMASVTDFNQANLQLTEAQLNVKRHALLMTLKRSEIDYLSGKPLTQWSIP